MSKLNRSWLKAFALGFIFIIVLIIPKSVSRAKVEEVAFAGVTTGCFDAPACDSTSLLGLSFTDSSFSGTSGAGTSESGIDLTNGYLSLNNLGSFTLDRGQHRYRGTFQLQITFDAPGGLTGGQTKTFSGYVSGSVTSDNDGRVMINFNNTPFPFTFSARDGNGVFQLAIFDVSLTPGQRVVLRGEITNASRIPGETLP